jgi:hypothetical protein
VDADNPNDPSPAAIDAFLGRWEGAKGSERANYQRDVPAAWPKSLPEQIQALRSALAAHSGPAGAADLAQGFARAPRAKVAELLDTLTG